MHCQHCQFEDGKHSFECPVQKAFEKGYKIGKLGQTIFEECPVGKKKCSECFVCIKKISKFCRSCFQKGTRNHRFGKKFFHALKTIKKMSQSKIKNKNPMWKGEKVGYGALHDWIKSRKRKIKLCQKCKKSFSYDLANKGIYNRELKNWEWLCRKCHMIKDGRMKKLKLGLTTLFSGKK